MNTTQIADYTLSFIQMITVRNFQRSLPNWHFEFISSTASVQGITEVSFRIDEGIDFELVRTAVMLTVGLPQNTRMPNNSGIINPKYFRAYFL